MCGIVGVFTSCTSLLNDSILQKMSATIAHRGPDASGVWMDQRAGIGFGHQRLAIIDLSPEGLQPMHSRCGRYVVAFNGEIYNFQEIKRELERKFQNIQWRGHSDTEILLAAAVRWGVSEAVKRFSGMFAFALWDKEKQELSLVRDRLGEKPLYYGWQKGVFLFGSELKALKVHPAFSGEIDRNSLSLFLRHSYIPAPYTIYKGIRKLPPGTFLKQSFNGKQLSIDEISEPQPYWSLFDVVEAGIAKPLLVADTSAVKTLDSLLLSSVKQQMVADVPLGAFLSGGIDSSTIVALMQAQSDSPVKTFTIGFNEKNYNEAEYAKAVANHLGTEHTELYVSPGEAMNVIPQLSALYDEPFSDVSQIPTFLVSQMTKQHVTVSLSGDGGDELFGGYNRYNSAVMLFRKFSWLPYPLRKNLSIILRGAPVWLWEYLGRLVNVGQAPDKIRKVIEILSAPNIESAYKYLISNWKQPSDVVIKGIEPQTVTNNFSQCPNLGDMEHRMMYLDTMSYLPDDILVKVDRAAMGVSLETRLPFLDHRVVEFSWSLPLSLKIRNGRGKWVLRQVLANYLPDKLIDRPKMGFGVPIDSWLRGPLRNWAEELLDESRLRREGFFNPQPIRKKWKEHLSGKMNWQYHIWDILMFQAWLEKQ
jgi:asparagine synthase (glutamine-hydrolysing)